MHGGSDGKKNVLKLGVEEYITSMEVHWGHKEGHTQIFYLSFKTSAGNSVSGGSMTERNNTVIAPEGFQLGGFFGLNSNAIDRLGVIWTRISTEDPEYLSALESDDFATAFSEGLSAAESVDTSDESADTLESFDGALVGSTAASARSEEADSTLTSTVGLVKTQATKASAIETSRQEAVELAKDPSKDDYDIASTDGSAEPSEERSSIDFITLAEDSTSGPAALVDHKASPPPDHKAPPPPDHKAPPAAPTISVKDSIVLSERFGASDHGKDFSDKNLVNSGQTVKSIAIYAGKRLDGITLTNSAPKPLTFTHGGTGGERKELQLGKDEHINSMEVHWGKKDGHTRIFYVSFLTSAGNALSGGSMTSDKKTVKAPEGFQLAGFFGKDGQEIDALGAVWAYIDLVKPEPTPPPDHKAPPPPDHKAPPPPDHKAPPPPDHKSPPPPDHKAQPPPDHKAPPPPDHKAPPPPDHKSPPPPDHKAPPPPDHKASPPPDHKASPPPDNKASPPPDNKAPPPPDHKAPPAAPTISVKDSIVLSERFGASDHGKDFSDKNLVNSGQTVKSIAIYAGKRLDGITLTNSAPKPLTFTHGGTGGERKELQLGKDEHINSMEVHWGKKDGHTRIFYVSFLTSTGNALSGGSMTSDKKTVKAPKGFQLAGFFGKDGQEIDALGAVWAYIDLVKPAATPVLPPITVEDSPYTAAEDDIAGSLSEVKTKTNKRAVQLSESFGGPHGEQFSDQPAVISGMTVASVTIRAAKRLDGLTVQVSAPKEMTFTHGGTGGKENTLTLEPGEYITTMEVHWAKKQVDGKTRIFYLSLGTSKGKTVSGGTKTAEKGSVTAPKGYQLAGFFGRDGDEIDHLGAVWSSIAAVDETILPSANDDIALSELFGGPHGIAFSDITKIKFGQTVSSVTIRSAERVDAVTLQITSPLPLTFNHGGHGGTEKTLTLAQDEVITSVEAHWAKKNGQTRVFYVCFTTSAGNRLAGGTQTDQKGTATAPEGFVLSGFYGRAEGEVDQLGVIWTRKTAKNILLTDPSGVGNTTYGTTIRNWVGPTIGKSSDTACYRKTTAFDSANMCPFGYGKEDTNCIVQCPLAYPVECATECLPQNGDCALDILSKAGSVVAVALNVATAGVFTSIYKAYETTKWAVMCAKNIYEVIHGIIFYLRYRQVSAPQGDIEELLTIAYQSELVLYDLPVAVMTCLRMPISPNAKYGKYVIAVVAGILKAVVTMPDEIISTGANVMSLLSGNGLINDTTIKVDELDDLVSKNTSCGYELKRLTDRVTRAVLKYRSTGASIDDIRVKVYDSSIVRNDIPIVTNNCMNELLRDKTKETAYETRDLLRKTFGVIVDQLIDTGKTDKGVNVADKEYMLEVANMGLLALSALDPTYIAYMTSQFVQPLCLPNAYVGEIDDGTLYDALGLHTVDEAFKGSYGSYTHAGDGVINLIFESVDTKDVTVVIHSGGDEYAKVDVGAGDTTSWDAAIPELEDKTLYLDRWRPGIFGLPGSGGGSLLLWIPRSSEGGHITMHVRINPS
ncbi:hypothetical protein KXD40_003862 [Peronospora effusa]|uniref:Jacalin-type lectin domain-containing protein n=1 Tax=Peronospora effusa TaxID=542832 RepID=A0A425C8V6_9STRA|nr:hypothetical protein DD237_007880 [Peronospora effusa]UIZ22793.1 hypothetical protein KXD40_003862 [Peronospora effusa]